MAHTSNRFLQEAAHFFSRGIGPAMEQPLQLGKGFPHILIFRPLPQSFEIQTPPILREDERRIDSILLGSPVNE
ncbi:MAG: hypothetical protein ACP5VF_01655, partial [Acidobacteriota bacterium]